MAKILLVSESQSTIIDVRRSLPGHLIVVARSFGEAVTMLACSTFAMTICSAHLRTGCAYELLRLVRTDPEQMDARFVFLSAKPTSAAKQVSRSTVATAMLLGADRYIIVQEFSPANFRKDIESLLQPLGEEEEEAMRHFLVQERRRAQRALDHGLRGEHMKILKQLFMKMQDKPGSFHSAELVSVQNDLWAAAGALDDEDS